MKNVHQPVMLHQVLEFFSLSPSHLVIDCNLGTGGHSLAIAQRLSTGKLVALDLDPRMIAIAQEVFASHQIPPARYHFIEGNFAELARLLTPLGITNADRILMDLGVALPQLTSPEYGLSIRHPGPLDGRYSPQQELTIAEVVNRFPFEELRRIIRELGEERWASRLARAIVRRRSEKEFSSTEELTALAERVIPRRYHPRRIHVATRLLMGLRKFCNAEVENLQQGLEQALRFLAPQGVMVVLSYDGIDDRIVKRRFRSAARGEEKGKFQLLTPRPLRPDDEEVRSNPRSRGARLRALLKVG